MNIKLYLLVFGMFFLSACNSEGDTGSSTNTENEFSSVNLIAGDAFAVINQSQADYINLQSFIRDPNAKLDSVSLVGSHEFPSELCDVAEISSDGLGVDIGEHENMYCEYAISASNGTVQSAAVLRVLATAVENPYLTPLTRDVNYMDNLTSLEIDLSEELASEWNTSYVLSSVVMHGEEGLKGSANIKQGTDDTLEFQIPDTQLPGWNRIFYTVVDKNSLEDIRIGEIYITMSNSQNTPPLIGLPFYEYHVAVDEFDLDFNSPRCNRYVGKNTSGTCEDFNEFNQYQFHSARYSAVGQNHVSHIELHPKPEYHGKKVTIFVTPDRLNDWSITVYNSQDENLLNEIVTIRKSGEDLKSLTFTNFNGTWYRQNSLPLISHTKYTLDLSQFSGLHIRDRDGDDWQVSSVSSSTAIVNLANEDDVFNKSIELEATRVGPHYVNYVINDHFGGFRSGIIQFYIEPHNNKNWSAITTDDDHLLSEPLLYSEYVEMHKNASDFYDASKVATVGVFTSKQAEAYCRSQNKTIPTIDVFDSHRAQLNQWPSDNLYWVYSNNASELSMYDLKTNSVVDEFVSSINTKRYTACLD